MNKDDFEFKTHVLQLSALRLRKEHYGPVADSVWTMLMARKYHS